MTRVAPTTDELREFISRLALVDGFAHTGKRVDSVGLAGPGLDADRLELVSVLESAKAALAAAQARVTVAFDASQRTAQREAGVSPARIGVGVAEQIALARRESPTRGSRHLGVAKALLHEMPHTMAALTAGELSEWRATLVVQATAVLDVDARREVDARLAGRLGKLSDRQVRAAASAVAYELDPRSVVDRAAYAVSQRRVSLRPAPDTMAYLTALLPAAQAVAVFAALHSTAGSARAAGDPRSSDQVKADTLVERVTGQSSAAAVPVEIGLVMTDASLLAGDHTPAVLIGYGPVPASVARDLARGGSGRHLAQAQGSGGIHPRAGDPSQAATVGGPSRIPDRDEGLAAGADARVWVRRLYADPVTSSIVDGDRRRRLFPAHLRRLVVVRDQWCRTPWCGAPIRHIDHAVGHGRGGLTELANAQGLCERCNHAKEALSWTTQVTTDGLGRAVVTTTTSAGLSHSSAAPSWNPAVCAASTVQPTPSPELQPMSPVRQPMSPVRPVRRVPRSHRAVDFAWAPPHSPWARLQVDLAPPA